MAEKKKSNLLGNLVKVGTGIIVGAGAGFVAGLMLAPKSGKETREDVKSVSLKLKTDTSEKVNDIKEKGEEMIRRGTSTLKIGQHNDDDISLPISTNQGVTTSAKEKNSTESLLERIQGVTADNLD